MTKKLLPFLFLCLPLSAVGQKVTNARFEQVGKQVEITYTLDKTSDISVYLSTDGGKTFGTSPLKALTGDAGKQVSAGQKKVLWSPLEERENLVSDNVMFKIVPSGVFTSGGHYIDLGLPSGTLWKDKNEEGGFYTYDQAVSRFGSKLPTKEQLTELNNSCTWTWQGNGYNVVGPNGNSIFLPAAGYRYCDGSVYGVGSDGNYWSSTPSGSDSAWCLYFHPGGVYMYDGNRCRGRSVRLVQ